MEVSWRENASFSLNWGILEEKKRDFRLNGGFSKENVCFSLKWGIREEKMCDFCITGGFAKRKCVFFASMGDSRREKARFLG